MKRLLYILSIALIAMVTMGAKSGCGSDSEATKEMRRVEQQTSQYAIGQPVPAFDWSFERHLMIQLYQLRNKKVATHAVWRSDYGLVEGDCPSMGYGLPYDVSLTNPLMATDEDQRGARNNALTSIEQPEPNGVFASKNTSATWVMCVGVSGSIEPVYVESKVTIYPSSVTVNYKTNRVVRTGKATVTISKK